MGVSPRKGLGQEGRLWLSKRPQLYLYYIFSSPGLFQREERDVFRFPIQFGLCLYFPALSTTMYLFPEHHSPGVCMWGLCLPLNDTVRVLLLNVERGMGGCVIVWPHLFSSGVHNQRGIVKKNKTMAQRPWNNCMMKDMVSTP